MLKNKVIATAIVAAVGFASHAQAMHIGKPITVPATVTQPGLMNGVTTPTKEVTLMGLNLTSAEWKAIHQRPVVEKSLIAAHHQLPESVDLGMNDVPVLDQGRHGSCVTFADTAALDAVLGKGDYISQLCNLELGSYLEKNSYMPSGWDGSYGPLVLEQMMRFGVVNKTNQKNNACANVSEYPVKQADNMGNDLSLTDFKAFSEDLNEKVYWEHILSNDQLFDLVTNPAEMDLVLDKVKSSLVEGNRMTFGSILIIAPHCSAGACASYHASNDTWALTPELDDPNNPIGGHEMVIIGYDDNAIAMDKHGKVHRGLLKLRNSWGAEVGDKGNFYMTYDYFKKYADEVQKIVKMED